MTRKYSFKILKNTKQNQNRVSWPNFGTMGASEEMVMSNWDEQVIARRANMPANLDMFGAELKKINYSLNKIIDLKK
jgi:hypothetical protein